MSSHNLMARIAFEWGERCFGKEHMRDLSVRSLRLAEEAVELAQASNVDRDMMHKLVDVVYDRPHGDQHQELGGVLLTAAVMSIAMGYDDVDYVFEHELCRCLSKNPMDFAKRNQDKLQLGLTG